MTDAMLAIGTRKGLFLARSSGGGPFEVEPIQFSTVAVHSVAIDTRGTTPRLLAGIEYGHFGPSVMYSDDLGKTWQEAERPPIIAAYLDRWGNVTKDHFGATSNNPGSEELDRLAARTPVFRVI